MCPEIIFGLAGGPTYILSSALIVASQITGVYLSLACQLTGNAFYRAIHVYLPTIIAGSLLPQ
jgi:hypothetical protein